MARSLFDVIRGIVSEQLRQVRTAEIGVVSEVFCGSGECNACSVELRNSTVVLGRVPVATPKIGMVAMPAVGDMVVVQFLDGDINAPVIVGSLYNDEDTPPESDEKKVVTHLPRDAGEDEAVHVEFCADDEKTIVFRVGKSAVVTLADKDPAICINVNDGNAKITIESDGTVAIKTNGDFKIESSGRVSIKGDAGVQIESSGKVEIKGAQVALN